MSRDVDLCHFQSLMAPSLGVRSKHGLARGCTDDTAGRFRLNSIWFYLPNRLQVFEDWERRIFMFLLSRNDGSWHKRSQGRGLAAFHFRHPKVNQRRVVFLVWCLVHLTIRLPPQKPISCANSFSLQRKQRERFLLWPQWTEGYCS